MNRRLIIMRHAKSSWSSGAKTDHDRPLNARGRRDAPRVAKKLVELGWLPELIVSSDSARTRETYQLMSEHLADCEVIFTEAMYLAPGSEILQTLVHYADDVQTVMTLSHNPGCEALVRFLSGHPELMTTANAALFEIESIPWVEAIERPEQWRLVEVIRPRAL